jgi:hypothetical protein
MIQAAISQALKIFSLLLLEIWYRNTKEEQINPTENIEDSLYVEVDIIGCVAAEIISAKGSKSVSHKPGPAFGLVCTLCFFKNCATFCSFIICIFTISIKIINVNYIRWYKRHFSKADTRRT